MVKPLSTALLLWVLATALSGALGSNFSKVSLTADPQALCMDGTTPALYYAPPPAAASLWIVHLAGGGWCYDAASCKARCGTPGARSLNPLCGSTTYPSTLSAKALSGLFAPSEASLAAAHKVLLPYCTGDAHMGDASSAQGWQFRGGRVVAAALQELVRRGLGANPGDVLVFGGSSAGGRGAMVHLDYVPEMLGPRASKNVRVVGFLDSALWVDAASFVPSFPGFNATTQGVFAQANVTHLGPGCPARYTEALWKCMFGEYRIPLLQTPYLLVASQDDAFQLGTNVGHQPETPQELAYAAAFANRTRELVLGLRAGRGDSGFFSWGCYNHAVALTDKGFNSEQAGQHPDTPGTMAQALAAVLGLRGNQSGLEWVDRCQGLNCGPGCSK